METIPYPAGYFEPLEDDSPVVATCYYCEKDLHAGDSVVDLREYKHEFVLCPICATHLFQISELKNENEEWGFEEC